MNPAVETSPAAAVATGGAQGAQLTLIRAQARLVASRQRLQATWVPPGRGSAGPAARSAARSARVGHWLRGWCDRLRELPVVGLAVETAERWWQHNPWRLAGQAVANELDEAVSPWVRRHPALGLAAAAGLGFAVVSTRPWAWPGVGDQLRPLPRRAGRWLLRQLTRAPLQTVLASLLLAAKAAMPHESDQPAHPAQPAQEPT